MTSESFTKVSQSALIYRLIKAIVYSIFLGVVIGGLFMIGGMQSGIFVVTVVAFVILLIPSFLEFSNLAYQLDSSAVHFRKGMLSIQNTTVPFARITNVSFNQSIFQRVFGVGDLDIDQEDSNYSWDGVDSENANKISREIASKSNIQQVSKVK